MTAVSALRESFKQVLSSNSKRQQERLEQAITVTALKVRPETEVMVPYLDHALDLWNSHADAIDAKLGKGWFDVRLRRVDALELRFIAKPARPSRSIFVPLRKKKPVAWWALASFKLDYLMATDPHPAYEWMSDMLLLASIPQEIFNDQATARDGFWNRRLRKRKKAIAQKQAVATREADLDLEQDQLRQKTRMERRDILARHEKLEELIRQAGDKDIAVGLPHGWRINPKIAYGGTGMLVPLSSRHRSKDSLRPTPNNLGPDVGAIHDADTEGDDPATK
jgi:hypothetical protein